MLLRIRTQGIFSFDCHQGNNEETFNYKKFNTVDKLPDDSDVKDAIDGWRIEFYQVLDLCETEPPSQTSFMETLMQQPEHISQYYTQIDFHTVPIRIYEHLKSFRKALITTDGGAVQFKGSQGFVIADEDAKCLGQPADHDLLSFRFKICAFLAAVKFITILIEYYDSQIPCNTKVRGTFQFFKDSSGRMKKLKAFDKYPSASLSIVLDSEWDVLSALHRALK